MGDQGAAVTSETGKSPEEIAQKIRVKKGAKNACF